MPRITLYGMLQYDPTLFDKVVLPEDIDKEILIDEIIRSSGQLYPYHQIPAVLKRSMGLWFARNFVNFERMMAALLAEYNPIENYDRHEDWTRTPNLTDKNTASGSDSSTASGSDTRTLTAGQTQTETRSGSDTTTRSYSNYSEKDTKSGSEEVEHKVAAYDSSTYENSTKDITSFTNREDGKSYTGTYSDLHTHDNDKTTMTGSGSDTDKTDYGKVDTQSYGRVDTNTHTGEEKYTAHLHGNIGVTTSQQMIESELQLRRFDIYAEIAQRFEHEFIVQVY